MLILLTVLFCCLFLFIAVDAVSRFCKLPVAAALPVALAAIIAFETVVLNFLSLFHAVGVLPLLVAHGLAAAGWCIVITFGKEGLGISRHIHFFRSAVLSPVLAPLVPLLIILLFGAVLYPPNNYDSMSYHMARVVHWIQLQSIDYYSTSIDRQNVMGPGAEYLILVPQLLAKSDVLANCVQLLAYIAIIFSVPFVLRLMAISREFRPFIMILTVTAPMAVMQATSTQNDLVAAAMTFAIIIAARRLFMGSLANFRYRDFFVLGVCLAAGFLVKPTSLLAVGPFFLIGAGRQAVQFPELRRCIGKCMVGGTLALLAGCTVAGPDMMRKYTHDVSRHEVYPLFSEWSRDRLRNPVAMAAHNVAIPEKPGKLLSSLGYDGHFSNKEVFTLHEDLIGNPFQMMALALSTAGTVFLFPILLRRKKLVLPFFLSLTPLLAWWGFGLMVKDQLWITRLQLPIFFLLPFSFLFILSLVKEKKAAVVSLRALIAWIAFLSLAYSVVVASSNPHRPISLKHFWGYSPDRTWSYYNNALQEDRLFHQNALNMARAQGCTQVGLILGNNSNEYPLSWRLIKEGREAKHLHTKAQDDDAEPCLYYVESGQENRLKGRGSRWLTVDGHTYSRNLPAEFSRATETLLELSFPGDISRLASLSDKVSLEPTSDGVLVMALDDDPQLLLPKFESPTWEWVTIEVAMVSSVQTNAQIFYKTAMSPEYSEAQSFRQSIPPGESKVYFLIPGNSLFGLIRFDPGQSTGEYTLKTITVRPISQIGKEL